MSLVRSSRGGGVVDEMMSVSRGSAERQLARFVLAATPRRAGTATGPRRDRGGGLT